MNKFGCKNCKHKDVWVDDEPCASCSNFSNWEQNILTNYDRIINQTPEKLAQLLCDIGECDRKCPAKIGDCIFSNSACIGAWLDWLRQEVT